MTWRAARSQPLPVSEDQVPATAMISMMVVEAMRPALVPNPGVRNVLAEESGDGDRHGHDRDPGGDPAHVVVLLHAGGGRSFGGDRGLGRGAGLVELDHSVQELPLLPDGPRSA